MEPQNQIIPFGTYYSQMNSEELINYCDSHSETERALFSKEQVAEMVLLAGCPEDWPLPQKIATDSTTWHSLKKPMKNLVFLARQNLSNIKKLPQN